MKCQLATHLSPVGGAYVTVSTSCRGAVVLSESLLANGEVSSFRIFIPREDILEGDWCTLWMVECGLFRRMIKIRTDYALILDILKGSDSWATKVVRLRCAFQLNTDFVTRKGY